MSELHGMHCCLIVVQDTFQEDPDDPGPRRFCLAVRDVNSRFPLSG